jgi:diaminohydroxyphosphoribosylaminopyrimidine deaminase / 5-amino-6-(5-phosphoribosylamino)uracil reductase
MHQRLAEKFMKLAIEQAKKGKDMASPNPLVGCVIVKNKKVISTGYHRKFGGPHAEAIALKKAGNRAKGSTAFITLEPCSYYGKTPPCTDVIIKSGIKEVICAGRDPNPLNNGRGIDMLRSAGIHVTSGILQRQAEKINLNFIKRVKAKRPYVTLKLAQSIDGKIATRKNDSKWISSERSRGIVQSLRSGHDAVMIGVNTVLIDNPLLSARGKARPHQLNKRQPVKIIVDSMLKTPVNAMIFSRLSPGHTIIAATHNAPSAKGKALKKIGADIISVNACKQGVNLNALMKALVEKGINSILFEGGGELAASMLEAGLVDKAYIFIAPIIIGGKDAIDSIGGIGPDKICKAKRLYNIKTKRVDGDILVEADVYRND